MAHEDIVQILTKLIDSDNLPHLLLYGPPGTGKTSTIVAAAKRMYGAKAYSSMALELNASDARGIDVVRNQIKEFAGTRQLFNTGIKLIILDEADAMTGDAQNALRRIIEKYTKNARFCLICNYVNKSKCTRISFVMFVLYLSQSLDQTDNATLLNQSHTHLYIVIPALQSRCTRFRFAPLSRDQIRDRLVHVANQEHVKYTEDGMEAILSLSGGDMRRVLNLLQTTAMSYPEEVNETAVYLTSGSPLPSDLDAILNSLMNDSFVTAQGKITDLCKNKGYAMADILSDLTTIVSSLELPPGALAELLDGMSGVEYRLAYGTDEEIQCASLVGVFVKARNLMTVAS